MATALAQTATAEQAVAQRDYPIYITVVRQNLDDTIAGAYPTLARARERKAECLAAPGTPSAPENMVTWDNSGLIAVAIYGVGGDLVEHLEQEAFGDDV